MIVRRRVRWWCEIVKGLSKGVNIQTASLERYLVYSYIKNMQYKNYSEIKQVVNYKGKEENYYCKTHNCGYLWKREDFHQKLEASKMPAKFSLDTCQFQCPLYKYLLIWSFQFYVLYSRYIILYYIPGIQKMLKGKTKCLDWFAKQKKK